MPERSWLLFSAHVATDSLGRIWHPCQILRQRCDSSLAMRIEISVAQGNRVLGALVAIRDP